MTLRSPRMAASRVRATGASAKSMCRSWHWAANSRVSPTGDVLISTKIEDAFMWATSPSGLQHTDLTASPSGKDKKMSSHWSAKVARLSALATPSSASRSNGSGNKSNPITFDRVFLARFKHMGSPMTPKPTKPILGSTVEFVCSAIPFPPIHFHYEATIQ